jgi:hypothetical protein
MGVATRWFVVPYFGRVVRYVRATPDNIAARKNIRERGLALLTELHKNEYERIIIVGHSLGSILAYDLVSYFWATRPESHTLREHTPEFETLRALEQATAALATASGDSTDPEGVAKFHDAQTEFCRHLRLRPKPSGDDRDTRWLITDLVTLGSPLSHAEFLLARSADDLDKAQAAREFPTSPPLREPLDPDLVPKAQAAGLPLDPNDPRLFAFPFGSSGEWQLHHAAPFAAVRWTNIHDPSLLVFCGDVISGPVAPVFGPSVIDVDLRKLRGQSWRFSHTRYWAMGRKAHASVPTHIAQLRKALDLAVQNRSM